MGGEGSKMMRSIIADSKYILESTGAQVYREKAKESRESIKRMKVAKLQQKEVVDQLKQRQNKLYGGVQDLEEVQKVLEKRRKEIVSEMKLPPDYFENLQTKS